MTVDFRDLKYLVQESNTDDLNHDYLLCPVCQSFFVDPYMTKCGHTMCKDCLIEALKTTKNHCPLDRQYLLREDNEELEIWPAPLILKVLTDDLRVKCVNECGWEGARTEIEEHLLECVPKAEKDSDKEQSEQDNVEENAEQEKPEISLQEQIETLTQKVDRIAMESKQQDKKYRMLIGSVPFLHNVNTESEQIKSLTSANISLVNRVNSLSFTIERLSAQLGHLMASHKHEIWRRSMISQDNSDTNESEKVRL